MAEQSKSLKIFAKVTDVSQGTIDVLKMIGETGPRPISKWIETAELLNRKPGGIPWKEWKRKNMAKPAQAQADRVEQHTAEEKEKDRNAGSGELPPAPDMPGGGKKVKKSKNK